MWRTVFAYGRKAEACQAQDLKTSLVLATMLSLSVTLRSPSHGNLDRAWPVQGCGGNKNPGQQGPQFLLAAHSSWIFKAPVPLQPCQEAQSAGAPERTETWKVRKTVTKRRTMKNMRAAARTGAGAVRKQEVLHSKEKQRTLGSISLQISSRSSPQSCSNVSGLQISLSHC